jgi:hypothetical protein
MKTYALTKVMCVACGGALTSCATQPETQKMPVAASILPGSSLTERVLREVNACRRGHGGSQLQRHSGPGVVADDDGTVFATQRFATVSRPQLFLRERFNRF